MTATADVRPDPCRDRAGALRLPCRGGRIGAAASRLLERITGLAELQRYYACLPRFDGAAAFIDAVLDTLRIRTHIELSAPGSVPEKGALLVVANHPFGAADGMILLRLLLETRSDVRILANRHLARIAELREVLIGVDPDRRRDSRICNGRALRVACRWLRSGGVLVVFPAGEVSHLRLGQRAVVDPPWGDTVGRLLEVTGADALPVHFRGHNSRLFSLAGIVHPLLRTLLLPRELLRLGGREVHCVVGRRIERRALQRLGTPAAITDYLRLRTGLLESWQREAADTDSVPGQIIAPGVPLRDPVPSSLLAAEIAHLPEDQKLCTLGDLHAYVARTSQIPWVMQEIGRLRETTFRQAGEGTGKATDIDLFDSFYHQLFLWNSAASEIAGAYRLGVVVEILQRYGRRGLYTQTLFRYGPGLLQRLHPAVELGRSFVRSEYQRNFAALNLLWRGIGQFVARHEIPVLFGPVSISREYSMVSRKLLVECLRHSAFEGTLARRVRPRHPFRPGRAPAMASSPTMLLRDVDIVSDLVAACEPDAKGIPILFRQYLRLGGRFIGFNVDADFSNVVDGLIVVDLRKTDARVLARYLGASDAARFRSGGDGRCALTG